jgi:hypothetical protein
MPRLLVFTVLLGASSLAGCDAPADSMDEPAAAAVGGKADSIGGDSYGALAAALVGPQYAQLMLDLEAFGPETLPHQAKGLRKQIAVVRDHLDLFVYAYPATKKKDRWQKIREDLDDGYESMGGFKDLFDVQGVDDPADASYDADEVAELRADVLDWQAFVLAPDRVAAAQAYLDAPELDDLEKRDADEMPRFYWSEAGIEPDLDDSGLDNLARLQRKLIDEARDDLADTRKLDKLHKTSQQVAFHDFRKRLRSIEKVGGYFPSIFGGAAPPAADFALLVEAVDRYGAINDHLVAYERAVERDDVADADALQDQIADEWDELKAWQKDVDLDDALHDVRRDVVH